ncbi:hypothetical protein IB238_12525 [Rhizobium sp. ARZ01]|uniref:hypothetical protein n=1 Tax=Rhizobium sp. ARZ01 TaxID=2769313 RepID=UPI0017836CB8|nr:hypothetical protein [Rhizobium sp. ARZ01]MBD9373445.1 hypothetical protein [Rhizobium sp. ARZ01]
MFFNSPFPYQPTPRNFFYADPAIGGGKTHSLEHHVAHPFSGKSIIGIQSIKLAQEIETNLINKGISVLRIDTDAFPYDEEKPTVTCTSIMNDAIESGKYQVIIGNQTVVTRVTSERVGEYNLFMDEIPTIHERIFLSGAVTSRASLASYMTSQPTPVDGYLQIRITDEGEKFLEMHYGEKLARLNETAVDAIDKINRHQHFDVFAETTIYRKFKDEFDQSLTLHVMMKPAIFDRFASVTILGANFLSSLMNLIWSGFYGVEFSLHRQIMTIGDEGIRYRDLKHKAATTTVYFHTNKNCSKTTYNQIDYQPTFDGSCAAVGKLLADLGYAEDTKSLVFLNNPPKGVKKFQWNDPNAMILSSAARGWDSYKEVDVAIFLAACNEHKETYTFLKAFFGLDKKAVDRATCLERAYQAVGRSSFRDMDSKRPVHLIFFDYRAAKFVADLIPGCSEPVFLDTGIDALAPKQAKTAAERKGKSRHGAGVNAVSELVDYEGFRRRKWMDRYDTKKHWDDVLSSWADWVADNRDFAMTDTPPKKELSVLYREGVYKSATDHKTKGNIEATKVITLDFDDVTRDPAELSAWLPFSHVITHSWSSKPGEWRFRLDVALRQPVTAYGYNHIVSHLLKDIRDRFGDAFTADKTKLTMMTRFHMPSVSIYGCDLFIDGTVMSGEQPVFLDVMAYMERDPITEEKPLKEPPPVADVVGTVSVESIMNRWAVPVGFGKGSINYTNAGVDLLFKAGLSPEETKEVMHTNRHMFGNGDDRDAEYTVDWILKSKEGA